MIPTRLLQMKNTAHVLNYLTSRWAHILLAAHICLFQALKMYVNPAIWKVIMKATNYKGNYNKNIIIGVKISDFRLFFESSRMWFQAIASCLWVPGSLWTKWENLMVISDETFHNVEALKLIPASSYLCLSIAIYIYLLIIRVAIYLSLDLDIFKFILSS